MINNISIDAIYNILIIDLIVYVYRELHSNYVGLEHTLDFKINIILWDKKLLIYTSTNNIINNIPSSKIDENKLINYNFKIKSLECNIIQKWKGNINKYKQKLF